MALLYGVIPKNTTFTATPILDAIPDATGSSAILKFFSGAQPANCAAADSGTLLATMNLPASWAEVSAAGSSQLNKLGTWYATASTAGTVGHFRIYNAAGTTCHVQGSVGIAGSGADMIVDVAALTVGMPLSVIQFNVTSGN